MIVLISVVPLAIYVDEILAFGLFCFGTSAGIAAFVGTLTANRRIPRTTTTKATARKRSIRRLLSVLMLIITPLCGIALGFLLI
jgi:hypothetical protein